MERQTAEIEATLRTAESNREFRLWLNIETNGATQATSDPIGFWKDPSRILLASYGATAQSFFAARSPAMRA